MATRPQGATRYARARLADRDEYPPLGTAVKVATRSGIVMGPPPRVQLTARSRSSAPRIVSTPIVAAPAKRAPKREAIPAPVVQIPEPAPVVQVAEPAPVVRIAEPVTVVAPVPAPAAVPELLVMVEEPRPEVTLTVPGERPAPETLTMPALAGRALKRRQDSAVRAMSL